MPELTFKGKEFVYNHHLSVPFRPLVPHPKKSLGKPDLGGNLIVHGDNLHALKTLLPMYAGKIDCIYIDPPYNTGEQTWAYNDNVNSPIMQSWLRENPVNSDDMLRHDKWASMMYPRLVMLRELLRDNGQIFVSINDMEVAILRMLMDEIMGEQSFICQFVWKSRQNKDNRNKAGVSIDHEYILAFGKKMRGADRKEEQYSNPDNDKRGPWTSGNMVGLASKKSRPNLHYDLIDPNTRVNYGCPDQGWRYGPETMQKLIAERRILWPTSTDGRPREKVFLKEMEDTTNISSVIGEGVFTRDGTEEVEQIFGQRVFPFPKPSQLIEELLRQGCPENGIVLDSFAGSGTTAHAVLSLNAKSGGSRRFILVECEDYADKITAERVRRIINGYQFDGVKREELLRETVTFTHLKKANEVLERIAGFENLDSHRFDNISKKVKDGILLVEGEKLIKSRTDGLGGEFTYCTLGEAIDLDKLLQGESLPSFEALGAVLFHTATSEAYDPAHLDERIGYLGESSAYHVWLIYKPDLDFLKSRDAALRPALAGVLRDALVTAFKADLPTAVACFEDDFDGCIAHLRVPITHRKATRTTNLLERLFGEERRRTKTIPHAFGERAVLKLMYAALVRASDSWRGVRITEFELRQLQALREDLERTYAERNTPTAKAETGGHPTKVSSTTRT